MSPKKIFKAPNRGFVEVLQLSNSVNITNYDLILKPNVRGID